MGNKTSKPTKKNAPSHSVITTTTKKSNSQAPRNSPLVTPKIEIPTWMVCKHYPPTESVISNLAAINKNEYVVSSKHALYKYNRETNTWNAYKVYPRGFKEFVCYDSSTISFDQQTSSLYVFNRRNELLKLNLNKFAVTKKSMNYKLFKHNTYRKEGLYNENSSSIFVNGVLHIIGGKFNNKHYVFDEKRHFKQIHKFKEHKPGFSKHAIIHVKTQNRLLLFGGCSQNNGYLNSIYSFSLSNGRWSKLMVRLPKISQNGLTCVVTRDEKYVIVLAAVSYQQLYGYHQSAYYDRRNRLRNNCEIWIMDLRTFEFKISDVHIPENMEAPFRAVLMDNYSTNKLLIYGFLRNVWNSLDKNDLRFISEDSMSIICQFYGDDDVHVLDIKGNHYKIKLEII